MTDDPHKDLRADLAHDRAYRDGLQTGFRLGQAGATETYESMKRHYTREISLAAKTLREIGEKDCGCGLANKCPDPPQCTPYDAEPVAWLTDAHNGVGEKCFVPAAEGDPGSFPVFAITGYSSS